MDKNTIAKVERQQRLKKQRAEDEAQARFELACADKNFAALVSEERSLKFDIGKNLHLGRDAADLQNRLAENAREQSAVLAKMGWSVDDLQPRYDCKICGDTGLVNGRRCVCFQNALNAELTKNSNITDDSLSLDTFKPQNDGQDKVAKALKRFLDKADGTKVKNILVCGRTGTGKTHLLNCLANDMLKQNYSVLFTSAFNFNNMLLQIHLAPAEEKSAMLDGLLNTDVLVLDDLGSENKYKNVSEEYFCNILNERVVKGKFTFISTNFDAARLQERYGDRILSRLVSDATFKINLDGGDLRLTKITKC